MKAAFYMFYKTHTNAKHLKTFGWKGTVEFGIIQLTGFHFSFGMCSMEFKAVLSGHPVAIEVCVCSVGDVFWIALWSRSDFCNLECWKALQQNPCFDWSLQESKDSSSSYAGDQGSWPSPFRLPPGSCATTIVCFQRQAGEEALLCQLTLGSLQGEAVSAHR